jgi:hypothetical protein
MRRSHRCPPAQAADRTLAGNGGHDRGRQGLPIVERREKSRDRPGEERLARARGPSEKQAVTTGEGNLEGAPCLQLAADLGQVGHVRELRRFGIRISLQLTGGRSRRELDPPGRRQGLSSGTGADGIRRFAQRGDADHLDAGGKAGLHDGVARDHDLPDPTPCQRRSEGQDARNRPDLAAE